MKPHFFTYLNRRNKIRHKKKMFVLFLIFFALFLVNISRLCILCVFQSEYYSDQAQILHERERKIKAARGIMYDRNGKVIATNRSVCTISVIHSQITDPDKVIACLSKELNLSESYVRKRVEKVSAIEKVKSNVAKDTGDIIRSFELDGVKVDEDYTRYYPYDTLASKVIGFTGSDNQGIIGLEVEYDEVLSGTEGRILAMTDARGVDLEAEGESRIEPIPGNNLYLTLDMNIQSYAAQLAQQALEQKSADSVSIIVMNCKNGEILAMVNEPEFDLNQPFLLSEKLLSMQTDSNSQDLLNTMWRNGCINDTYEPGSTFKIITAAAALEEDVVNINSTFSCPGFIIVEDRKIRCHKVGGHGGETFLQGTMNSCNPVFISVGLRLGAEKFYSYFLKWKLLEKTGVDLPGEATAIMHKKEAIGLVELATVSFGQSFQVTPLGLLTAAATIVNGGTRVTPHLGLGTEENSTGVITKLQFSVQEKMVSSETSETMRYILEQVVENGTGKNGYVEGFRVGGKTATSQTLPRGSGKYIASYIGFTPANDPDLIAIAIIHNPKGVYYGGQVAAPLIRQLFQNILPYLDGIDYNEQWSE